MSRHSPEEITAIARTVHEAVRAWAAAHGQGAIPHWNSAPAWMRASSRESVQFVLDHPDADDGAQHDQWMAQKKRDGWVYGAVRDDDKKHHPMLVPFKDLPEFEKRKDTLLRAIVAALA